MGTTAGKGTNDDSSQPPQQEQEQIDYPQNNSDTSFLDSENEDEDDNISEWASVLGTGLSKDEQSDKKILRERFKMLNNGEERQPLHREVFDKEPYCDNQFCQRLVSNFIQSFSSDKNKVTITFTEFYDAVTKWQRLEDSEKLDGIFSMLKTNECISHNILWQILHHSLPSCYSEHECKLLAKIVIKSMAGDQSVKGITSSEYKKWITENVPTERLKEVLDFKISDLK